MKYFAILGIILLSLVYGGCTTHTTITPETTQNSAKIYQSIDTGDVYTGGVIDIVHNSLSEKYNLVHFYIGDENDETITQTKIYNKRKSQGFDCQEGDFGIGGNAKCINSTGYIHTYTIPQLHIFISQSTGGNYDQSRQPLTKDPQNPFILSGTTLYTILDKNQPLSKRAAITYHTFGNNETIESVIYHQINKNYPHMYLLGTGESFISGDREEYHLPYYHTGDQFDDTDLVDFTISYYFNRQKGYYYTAYNTPQSWGEDGEHGKGIEKILHYKIHFFQ